PTKCLEVSAISGGCPQSLAGTTRRPRTTANRAQASICCSAVSLCGLLLAITIRGIGSHSGVDDRRLLGGEQLEDPVLGQVEHPLELGAAEVAALARALDLDQPRTRPLGPASHDHIEIDVGAAVLVVT